MIFGKPLEEKGPSKTPLEEELTMLRTVLECADCKEGGKKNQFLVLNTKKNKRFKLSDASGKLTFTQLQEGELDRSVLDSNDSFIVDNGSEVFVWIGKKVFYFSYLNC